MTAPAAPAPITRIGLLAFDGVEELDLLGPWEMFNTWRMHEAGPDCVLVAQQLAPVHCAKGLVILPQHGFDTCPALDVLLVPGGQGTWREVNNAGLLAWVATQAASAQAVLSVCTGSFVLHTAGLLQGRRATTHWASLERLRALPGVQVVEERVVRDGPVWTSAGVSAGIDLALAFIAEVAGDDMAGRVQLGTEYYPSGQRYGHWHDDPRAPGYLRRP